ncbi:LysR family transcriptional regulator [Mesorhizobium alhagi CCNWXJ12-2]|uniref:LysR family transcriptional regulator n=1 Tax=Mesorhizobium alhagi CCNWXJ12-2 TaxID=1107882 RepID=H0HUB1_9HYPH|nr:LysR family transcriptional regulator [Mesorhizobium alhagi CCNWXJ12-2]
MWGGSRRYLLNRKPIRTLPPMTSLPVFEAVGRHLSVAKAAEELCLTPGAVSRQVRNLESFLACPLFKRAHRRIVFTKAGEQYWSKIHATLGEIRFVTQDISATSDSRPLVIGSPRVFLQKCVLPVLGTLYTNHPEIAVKFVVGGEDDDVMDGAIRVGTGAAPKGYVSEILADGVFARFAAHPIYARLRRLPIPTIWSTTSFCAQPNSPRTGSAGSARAPPGYSPTHAS